MHTKRKSQMRNGNSKQNYSPGRITGNRPRIERNYEYDRGDLQHRRIHDYDFDNREYAAMNLEGEYKYDDTGKKYLRHNDYEDVQRYGRTGSYRGNFYRMRNQYEGPFVLENSYQKYNRERDRYYDFDREYNEREKEKKSNNNEMKNNRRVRITPAKRRRMTGTSTSSRINNLKSTAGNRTPAGQRIYESTFFEEGSRRAPRASLYSKRGHNKSEHESPRMYGRNYR